MDRKGAVSTAWTALLIVAMAGTAAVLGAIGFTEFFRDKPCGASCPTGLDIAYYTAQLFVLSPTPLEQPGVLNPALEIARFLAPLTTILAVGQAVWVLLRDQIRAWVTAHVRSGHAVVTGDTPAAVALARRLAGGGWRVVMIGTVGAQDLARRHRVHVVAGDPADPATLRAAGVKRAATVYACAPDSARNAAVALLAHVPRRHPVAVYAQVRDGELVLALRARRLGAARDANFRLDFFSLENLAARVLLDQYPPRLPGGEPASVVIVGFGSFARAALEELTARSDRRDDRPAVTVVTADSAAVRDFGAAHALAARGCPVVDRPAMPAVGPDALVYVCLEDTDEALRVGLNLVRTAASRVVMCLGERTALGEALAPEGVFDDARGKLAVFGILDAACDPDLLSHDLVDQLARALHERYLQMCRADGARPEAVPNLRPWAELGPEIKRSNYRQAEHVGVKLDAIDAVVVPAMPGSAPFAYRVGEVERLARMEHERWMADARAEGRSHPDLLPWEELSPQSRQKDVDFVTFLPELLTDHRLAILRRAPESGT